MIDITVNENKHTIAENTSIATLLKSINRNRNGIAIAINGAVVPKKDWDKMALKSNDKILIIQATQGG